LIYEIAKYLKKSFRFNPYIVLPKKNLVTAKVMRDLMRKADLCISAGGQTTYELAKVGVPTIGICFADNQIFNLQGWQEKGFIEYVGGHANRDLLARLSAAITKFLPYDERCRRSVIGRRWVDGKGANRVIKALID
jgi:spore coat polysaccharide biosynthesis predicted glycosyltransferase SpsG